MKKIIVFALIIHGINSFAQSVLYISTNKDELVRFDIGHCTLTTIGTTQSPMIDIATCPDGSMYGTNGGELFSINTSNAAANPINFNDTATVFMNSLVCDKTGQLYAAGGQAVYAVNKINAHITLLGSNTGYTAEGDLTCYNDTLYESATRNDTSLLLRILLNPFEIVEVGVLPNNFVYGLATISDCAANTKEMLAFALTDIYKVSPYNGNTTLLCSGIVQDDFIIGAASAGDDFTPTVTNMNTVLTMPNVFTPNGDNKNDCFCVNNEGLSDVNLKIYNRWGTLLYETVNIATGWNGTYKGTSVPEGVYYWILNYTTVCAGASNLKGFVTLLR